MPLSFLLIAALTALVTYSWQWLIERDRDKREWDEILTGKKKTNWLRLVLITLAVAWAITLFLGVNGFLD